jgi:alcohol dehydrogenase class IV
MVGTASGEFDDLVALLATGKPFAPHRAKTLIAVPTTSGTGSEVTGLGDGVEPRPRARSTPCTCPRRGPRRPLVDPELTLSLPAGPTLAAGLDALSHALESIWNVNANPVSDNHAVAGARMVLANLPR